MSEQSLANDTQVTDTAGSTENQATTARTYTQEEFDRHMAGLKSSLTKKYEKMYSDLGDVEELRQLKSQAEAKQMEDAKKRGEFDKIIQDLAAKKDAEIQKRDAIIAQYRVEVPLLDAAAKNRSVNPEQVKALLRNQVRVNAEGETEVVDSSGKPMYKDSGVPFGVEDLVADFLAKNPHFVQPGPATTVTRNAIATEGRGQVDISSLDMRKAGDRQLYAELRAKKAR